MLQIGHGKDLSLYASESVAHLMKQQMHCKCKSHVFWSIHYMVAPHCTLFSVSQLLLRDKAKLEA
jgi:hypothetical protein